MRLATLIPVVLLLGTFAPSQGSPHPSPKWEIPFSKYPASEVFQGRPVPPITSTGNARMFRTRLREAARKGPNFAGHYTIAEWGCGSGCLSFAIVDALTGQVHWPPFSADIVGIPWLGTATGREYQGIVYRLDSRLLIIDGCPDDKERGCGTYYFEWTGNKLKRLRFNSVPQKKD